MMDARMLMDDTRPLQVRRMIPRESLADPSAIGLAPPPPVPSSVDVGAQSMLPQPRAIKPAPSPMAQKQAAAPVSRGSSISDVRAIMRKDAEQFRQESGLEMSDALLNQDTDILMAHWEAAEAKRAGKQRAKKFSESLSAFRAMQSKYANAEDSYDDRMLPLSQQGRRSLAIRNDPNASDEERAKAKETLLEVKERMDAIKGNRDKLSKTMRNFKDRISKEFKLSAQDVNDILENPYFDHTLRAETETQDFRDDSNVRDEQIFGHFYASPGTSNEPR